MPTKLDLFDFDGTLFESPVDNEKNKQKYEKATGLPWIIDKEASKRLSKEHGYHIGMRRGWWGRAETLEPPLVPDPAPKEWFKKDPCEAFLASKSNPDTLTLLLTGRYSGLQRHVLRILGQGGLMDVNKGTFPKSDKVFITQADDAVAFFCLGDKALSSTVNNGPMPNETFPWKIWVIEQYLMLLPEIKTVEVWEDRPEHVEKFKEILDCMVENVIVNHVQ